MLIWFMQRLNLSNVKYVQKIFETNLTFKWLRFFVDRVNIVLNVNLTFKWSQVFVNCVSNVTYFTLKWL